MPKININGRDVHTEDMNKTERDMVAAIKVIDKKAEEAVERLNLLNRLRRRSVWSEHERNQNAEPK